MKKFFSMFAFAATLVLGVLTLASCDKDDDNGGPNATHNFTIDTKLESNLASVRESEDFKNDKIAFSEEIRKQLKERGLLPTMTDTQAVIFWSSFRDDPKAKQQVQDLLDDCAEFYKDRTLSLTIIFLRDGKEWHSAKWTTNYKDQWYN